MKRPDETTKSLVKTTIFLPKPMVMNLRYMALQTKYSQADLVRAAVDMMLRAAGYDPEKIPKVSPPMYD